ncbi:putative claudin-24 [Rhinatrema bivittatum]|uniref:putative claudin-24 n=1 Tax=Rhinatrema bivittatum TaxID=194408 RepID=UPI00112678D5|nr:putative claudin-24 [Rhinatrema bivittatum]
MEMGPCLAEIIGLLLSLLGCVCSLVAILMPQWLTVSSGLLVNENFLLSLWETCVIQDLNRSVCKSHSNLLALPPDIRMTRIFMCLSLSHGFLGFAVATPALTCVTFLGDHEIHTKRNMIICGGILVFLAGVLTLVPVAYMTHTTAVKFWDPTLGSLVPRWECGNAMISAWLSGFLLLVGSIILIKSQFCVGRMPERMGHSPVQPLAYTEVPSKMESV